MTDQIKPLNLNAEAETKNQSPAMETAMPTAKPQSPAKKKMMTWLLLLVLLGVGSGYGLFKLSQPKSPKKLKSSVEGEMNKGDTFGVMDEEAFRDMAEGEMTAGGIDGEGSHHLIREGGESQYVYLTSSIIDLDQFVGKKVKVWGETFEAQQAGWLMDVGRLEVLE